MMKKRVLSIALVICFLFSLTNGMSASALDLTKSESAALSAKEEPIETEEPYGKIHFYFDTPEHAYMDDAAELQSAVASVKSDYEAVAAMSARSGEANDENVYITVQFDADYMETGEYKSPAEDLANAKRPNKEIF